MSAAMLDYTLLEALAAVVREGSFERAASVLHVTPSAISQRVKLLEERMGAVLVVRGRPCSATPAGAPLCRHVEQVALLEQELRARLPLLAAYGPAAPLPTVRIAAGADSIAIWFVRALSRFAAHRAVLLDVVIEDQDHSAELLRSGAVHGAVTSLAEPVQGCRSARLGTLRYLATCAPAFHARHFSRGVTRAALSQAPCLYFNHKDALQHTFARQLVRSDIDMPLHRLPNVHAFVEACVHELGWGMHPETLVREHLDAGRLVEVAPGRKLDVALYWQSWRVSSAWFEELSTGIVDAARSGLRQRQR